jgi:hypothetical protein
MQRSNRKRNILSRKDFARRMMKYFIYSFLLIFISLFIGILGYHFIADLNWVDRTLNASMILTGMGPVDRLTTDSAKIFSSAYSIFSGVEFLSTVAIFFSPIAHRLLHILHVGDDEPSLN